MANKKIPSSGTQVATKVATKAITNTKVAVATAVLGVAAIAAAAVGSITNTCTSNAAQTINLDGSWKIVEACKGETLYFRNVTDGKIAWLGWFKVGDYGSDGMEIQKIGTQSIKPLQEILPKKKIFPFFVQKENYQFSGFYYGTNMTTNKARFYIKYKEESVSVECKDSDGGIKYNEKGVTTGPFERGRVQGEYPDFCATYIGGTAATSGPYIAERHCTGTEDDRYVHTQWYKCPYGCDGGECLLDISGGVELTFAKDISIPNGSVSAGNKQMIGAYMMTSNDTEGACPREIVLELNTDANLNDLLSWVKVQDEFGNDLAIFEQPESSNTFKPNFCLPKNITRKIKVFTDIKSVAQKGSITTQIGPFAYKGETSGIEKVSNDKIKGQTFTFEGQYTADCEDSDGKDNFDEAGKVTVTSPTSTSEYVDFCSPYGTNETVYDYYCPSDTTSFSYVPSTAKNCADEGKVCQDGACVTTSTPSTVSALGVVKVSLGSTNLKNGFIDLAKFRITNNESNDIKINNIVSGLQLSGVNVSTIQLYETYDNGEYLLGTVNNPSYTGIVFSPEQDFSLASGITKEITIRASVSGVEYGDHIRAYLSSITYANPSNGKVTVWEDFVGGDFLN